MADGPTPDNRPFAVTVDRRHLQEGDHSSLDRCAVARAVLEAYPGLWGALVFSDGAVLTYPPIPGWRRPVPTERYHHDGADPLRRLGELVEVGASVDGLAGWRVAFVPVNPDPDDPADDELDGADEATLKRDYPSTWTSPDRPRTRRAADLYEEGVRQALLESGIDPETERSFLEIEGEVEDPEEPPSRGRASTRPQPARPSLYATAPTPDQRGRGQHHRLIGAVNDA